MHNPFDNLLKNVSKAFANLGKDIEAEAVKEAPVVTGNLRNSIVAGQPQQSGSVLVMPISMTQYGIFLNEGTGLYSKERHAKYQILPKNKKALKTPFGIFTSVWHPGIEGRHFIQDAIHNVIDSGEMEANINKVLL